MINSEYYIKQITEKFNLKYQFNSQTLRPFAENIEDMISAVEYLSEQVYTITLAIEKAKLIGKIAAYQTIVGHLEEAENNLIEAIAILNKEEEQLDFVLGIRLATVLQYSGKLKESTKMFEELMSKAKQNDALNKYVHFVHQHYGKNEFDKRNFEDALQHFKEALTIRKQIKKPLLIQSTELAINSTLQKIKQNK